PPTQPPIARANLEFEFPVLASVATSPISPPLAPFPPEAAACRLSPSPDLPETRPQDATLARPLKQVIQACRKDTTLHAVVSGLEAVLGDQVLPDPLGRKPLAELGQNQFAMRFAFATPAQSRGVW